MSRVKRYLIAVIIQILLIAGYTVANFYAFKQEAVVLEPLKYILPAAILLIVIDAIVVFFILKNSKKTNEVKNNEQEKQEQKV